MERFPWRIYTRIVIAQNLIVLLILGLAGVSARSYFKNHFLEQIELQLKDTLLSLAPSLPSTASASAQNWCSVHAHGTSFRFTLIATDGTVICDSHHDAATMVNHANRPEVQAALSGGFGQSIRGSETLNEDMLYGAIQTGTQAGTWILRAAIPLSRLAESLKVFDQALLAFLSVVGVLLMLVAAWAGRKLVFPIGRILRKTHDLIEGPEAAEAPVAEVDLDLDLGSEALGEWSELEASIDHIRRDLEGKVEALTQEREEQAILMSAISDAILAVDLEERPLFYNSRFALLVGKERGQEDLSRGPRLWEIFRDPSILEAFRLALKEGQPSSVKALPFVSEEGRRFFSVSVSPLRRNDEEVYGAVGVFHDVTDLKRAEQIRIDFVANVSHELRTPLTAIKGYTDTLLEDAVKGLPPEKSFVEVIKRNADRLMALINDLLDLSSIESTDSLHLSRVRTQEFTSRVIQQLQNRFDAKKQSVTVRAEVDEFQADPQRLEQVLTNLLDNASKFTPAEGKILVTWTTGGRDHVLLKVVDSGPGIAPEHQSRLFERFYRVDKGRSREQGGTGLGLAIVKHIVQRHNGTVWVESQVGKGAAFICSFPK